MSVRGGKGVYHHPDCFNVTGEWDGAEKTPTLGERVVHTAGVLATSSLRPAECCQPPLFHQQPMLSGRPATESAPRPWPGASLARWLESSPRGAPGVRV